MNAIVQEALRLGSELALAHAAEPSVEPDRPAAWVALATGFGPDVSNVRDWRARDWAHKLAVEAEAALAYAA